MSYFKHRRQVDQSYDYGNSSNILIVDEFPFILGWDVCIGSTIKGEKIFWTINLKNNEREISSRVFDKIEVIEAHHKHFTHYSFHGRKNYGCPCVNKKHEAFRHISCNKFNQFRFKTFDEFRKSNRFADTFFVAKFISAMKNVDDDMSHKFYLEEENPKYVEFMNKIIDHINRIPEYYQAKFILDQ